VSGDLENGVILSHGGSAIGYALYLKEGKAVFAVRHANDSVVRVSSESAIKEGGTILAEVRKDGTLSLSVDGNAPVAASSGGLIDRHPQEDLSIGFDDKNPVDPEAPQKKFSGRLDAIEVQLQ
jgi:arylsulfatase